MKMTIKTPHLPITFNLTLWSPLHPERGNRYYQMIVFIVLLLFLPGHSQTPLSGDIHDYPFAASESPYVVGENIIIPSGKTCTIPAGCVFLFQPFTGLTVEGTLIAKGTDEQPVVFSSANDTEFNQSSPQPPNPFDWNGITIAAESYGTTFEHVRVCYSVYGIKSQTPNITIKQCLFYQNGQYHFTVKEQILNVLENFAFSYPVVDTTRDDSTKIPPGLGTVSTGKPKHIGLRIGCLVAGIGGIAGGAVAYTMVQDKDREIQTMLPDAINPATGTTYTRAEVIKARERRRLLSAGSIGGFVLGGLGLTGFVLTFVF